MSGGAGLRFRQLESLSAVSPDDWNSLFDPAYPFTRHEFLHALERTHCVAGRRGWTPFHLVAETQSGHLAAAAPLYLKDHSFGEFVFDFAWAEAAGRAYYPKLLCAIPFSPVTGPRIGGPADARSALAARLAALVEERWSSAHALFLERDDLAALSASGFVERNDVQFHWHNAGYESFDDFLSRLRADKRKKILRERRRVAEAGIGFDCVRGDALDEAQWNAVYHLYANTYEERGQPPYLSFAFFCEYGMRAGTPLRLVLAREGGRLVAAAITLLGGDTLYGRHWGAAENYHSLHFETCYYQGIEWCIRERLARFDAGAQGEHKLARGFDPVVVRSAHRLRDPRLHAAVEAHVRRERAWVESRRRELQEHAPYRTKDG